jgi:bleomycin hydrolase
VSNLLDDWSVTNQKNSGRCWLFAGLNLLRVGAAQAMNLKEFEFSQNHLMFWDKLERANYFLEAMIETADRDLDDRTVAYLLSEVANDGGQWNMFVALVTKHGVVPKTVMPETHSSSKTGRMNEILQSVLRQGALELRGCPAEQQQERKQRIVADVYRILCIHLGTPPERFVWQWSDKDRVFHRDAETTPQEFAAKYVQLPLSDYVCPGRRSSAKQPEGADVHRGISRERRRWRSRRLPQRRRCGHEEGGHGRHRRRQPCVVRLRRRQDAEQRPGIWDARLYDLESVYDVSFSLDKAERLASHDTR